MLEAGLAWHYWRIPKTRHSAEPKRTHATHLKGLWADPEPIAPWEFRKRPAAKKAA